MLVSRIKTTVWTVKGSRIKSYRLWWEIVQKYQTWRILTLTQARGLESYCRLTYLSLLILILFQRYKAKYGNTTNIFACSVTGRSNNLVKEWLIF